jgi:hypothetical protein
MEHRPVKKLTLILALLFCSAAQAGVENMVAQCEAVMRCDLCRVALDKEAYPGEMKQIFLPKLGLRFISVADYNWIRNAVDTKTDAGKYLMCERVAEAMQAPDSPRGIVARSLFDASWKPQDYCPFSAR